MFDKLLRQSGVDVFNGAQGRILYVLWENRNLSITDVSKLTSLSKNTLTSMLDRMECDGLIRRVRDTRNRRRVFVELTDKVVAYRGMYEKISEQTNQIFYSGFDEDEILDFEGKLMRIIENLEKEGV